MLLLLLVVVLVPTSGVLWFMSQAMGNEQLAVRQKLSDVYQAELIGLQQELQQYWQARSAALEAPELVGEESSAPSALVFAERVRGGLADSVVVYDPTGRPAYPALALANAPSPETVTADWRRAERLEHSGQSQLAAKRYAAIAEATEDRNLAGRALQAQARCLARAGAMPAAISILAEELSLPEYERAVDAQGRLIAPSALLRALELIGDGSDAAFETIIDTLVERLRSYRDPVIPSAQRLFLMKQLGEVAAVELDFDTLSAELLAERYLASDPPTAPTTSLQPSGLEGIWHLASPSGAVVALYEQERLNQVVESLIARRALPQSTTVELLVPGEEPPDLFLVSLPAGGFLQDWQLVLRPEDQTLFARAANQRIKAYLLTGVLVVGTIVGLAMLVARLIERQLRLTRLKNDLLATVSHELKTPLASMRLLVDTLLETGTGDAQRTDDYLRLIAKENLRLSRLVDNFLTFSRMEQGRQAFDLEPVPAGSIAEAAADSFSERFRAAGCRFEVQIASDLPSIVADRDALLTVLLNLLDNAYKYSPEEKHIVLSGYLEAGQVCFTVRDNGIGLSSRVTGKIFDRFYQVDQRLSRPGAGCGLGLSIVKFIVSAHGGSVAVDSQLGEGSTFTVRLPVADGTQGSPEEIR